MQFPLTFTANVTTGSGKGKLIGTPTINLSTDKLPAMDEGIYACTATLDGKTEKAVMHYGPRPVFNDPKPSCEVHLLDRLLNGAPASLEVTVIGYLREIRDYPTVDGLRYQIERDIDDARAMLANA